MLLIAPPRLGLCWRLPVAAIGPGQPRARVVSAGSIERGASPALARWLFRIWTNWVSAAAGSAPARAGVASGRAAMVERVRIVRKRRIGTFRRFSVWTTSDFVSAGTQRDLRPSGGALVGSRRMARRLWIPVAAPVALFADALVGRRLLAD